MSTPISTEIYCDYLAGVGHYSHADAAEAQLLTPGAALKIVPEPTNEYDPDAIAIHAGDYKLGFIKRVHTGPIHDFLKHSDKLTVSAYLNHYDATNPDYKKISVKVIVTPTNEN